MCSTKSTSKASRARDWLVSFLKSTDRSPRTRFSLARWSFCVMPSLNFPWWGTAGESVKMNSLLIWRGLIGRRRGYDELVTYLTWVHRQKGFRWTCYLLDVGWSTGERVKVNLLHIWRGLIGRRKGYDELLTYLTWADRQEKGLQWTCYLIDVGWWAGDGVTVNLLLIWRGLMGRRWGNGELVTYLTWADGQEMG